MMIMIIKKDDINYNNDNNVLLLIALDKLYSIPVIQNITNQSSAVVDIKFRVKRSFANLFLSSTVF